MKHSKIWIIALALFSLSQLFYSCKQENQIASDFKAAKGPSPYVIWQWMNGVVTKEGITYDSGRVQEGRYYQCATIFNWPYTA